MILLESISDGAGNKGALDGGHDLLTLLKDPLHLGPE